MKKTRSQSTLSAFFCIATACLAVSPLPTSCDNSTTTTEQKFDVTLPIIEKPTHTKRMRKSNKKEKKVKRSRTYVDFEYDELARAKDVQVEKKNIHVAIKYLEQMMKLCSNISLLADHLLEIADLFFADSQFQKSAHLYKQYCTLYPGSAKQEYALYRSITSSFECILSIDRDQTKTEETLVLIDQILQQDHFTLYKNEVTAIQVQCYERLAASEFNICSFYLTRGKLTAAEKRLAKIRASWLPKLPTIEPTIIALETQLAEQKEEIELLRNHNLSRAQQLTPSSIAFDGDPNENEVKIGEKKSGAKKKHTKLAHNKRTKHMADRF